MATVRLVNSDWQNGVNVDIRIGTDADPERNSPYWTGRVAYQSAVTIDQQDTTVWHRRDLDPNHSTNPPTYGGWMGTEVYETDVEDTI
jgi:hypothetical protein